MGLSLFDWWISAQSLGWRLGFGAVFFIALAVWDFRRKGRTATRWREYLYLLSAVLAALLYGLALDQITACISWEYFYYGKGIFINGIAFEKMSALDFRLAVAAIAVKATWWVGLILAAVQLFVNSLGTGRPHLSYRKLFATWRMVLLVSLLMGVAGGLCGWLGIFEGMEEFRDLVSEDLFRPRLFMTVWGVNLGEYTGAIAGLMASVFVIVGKRRKLEADTEPETGKAVLTQLREERCEENGVT